VSDVDEVHLVLPARPELMRLARVTAAGLAGRMDFDYAEIEDIRLAVDESCAMLLRVGSARPASTARTAAERAATGEHSAEREAGEALDIDVLFRVEPDRLVIEGHQILHAPSPSGRRPPPRSAITEVVLSALVDEHHLSGEAPGPRFRIVKLRHGGGLSRDSSERDDGANRPG
jgi:hypothetical protein